MSGSSSGENNRYHVEQGTDGSWLVVDRGEDRTQRIAVGCQPSAEAARQEADTLSTMDSITSAFETPSTGPRAEIDRIVADTTAAIDAEHNYNNLLPPDPGTGS